MAALKKKINQNLIVISDDRIESKIFLIRGKKVMFDLDLAKLYEVETKVLNQAVKRNLKRFPEDFMFRLNEQEVEIWKSQIVISNLRSQIVTSNSRSQFVTLKQGQNVKYTPHVFTEQGVAMLSSVLKSERAIQVNIQIMRTFSKIREMLASNKELREKIENLEKKYDKQFAMVFTAIKQLMDDPKPSMGKIGFRS